MTTSKRYSSFALLLGCGWLLAVACGADADSPNAGGPGSVGGVGNGAGGKSGGATVVSPGGTSGSSGQLDRLNPLCGQGETAGACVPDDARACVGYEPPPAPGASGAGGEGGMATGGGPAAGGEPSSAGGAQAGESEGGAAGGAGEAASAGGQAASAGAGGESGQGGAAPMPGPQAAYGCQVTRRNNQPSRECVAAGVGAANAPCFTAADCAPGLACVTEGEAGRCLPYCCDQASTCEAGSYCADRSLRKAPSDPSDAEPPRVPVCVPADGCSLEDRYPCPDGSECRCKGKTACMVVRDDGTTTCLEPGTGERGDACPCAWNHVCSKLTQQCVKLCRTDATTDECGAQKCQASSELPDNFGVCVGPSE